ncbi:MAG: anthranilate synthase component I family protein [bacterium]|nr:anthranilate synthase component I family protein [bacterium]
MRAATSQRRLKIASSPGAVCAALRAERAEALLLDGQGAFDDRWSVGPLVALHPRPLLEHPARRAATGDALGSLERVIDRRRAAGGAPETGVAVLAGYDLFPRNDARARDENLPDLVAFEVDRSLRFEGGGVARLTVRDGALDRWAERLDEIDGADAESHDAARAAGAPVTSLPRELYLERVAHVRQHIAAGDIYQANLSQRFAVDYRGDELTLYRDLLRAKPAPRSAFLATHEFALASASPETFLRVVAPDHIETLPIKGTRPRDLASDAKDRDAARQLMTSAKDRAELLMIVDLERNDLGRVCRTGTVEVPQLNELRSYPTVHHLMARVAGRLRDDVGVAELLRATFPGGSITGAPKIRAMQILDELEPVRRNFFTGGLFWFGDDGSVESSILIRTALFANGRAFVGAGGGVVADSDPEAEWRESNHKARAWTAALGFDPEEAR